MEALGVHVDAQKIMDIVKVHSDAEMAGDIDAVMATLCDHPVFNIYPMNARIEGTEAVRAMYTNLIFPGFYDFDSVGTWVNETSLIRMDVVHVKVAAGGNLFGVTVDSDKAFDLRTTSEFPVAPETLDSDAPLLVGENVMFDASILMRELGLNAPDVNLVS